MSSTGSAPRLGGAEDFFITPSYTVDRLFDDYRLDGGLWVEPTAGNGAIIRAVNSLRSDVHWIAVEIREEERAGLEATGATVYIDSFFDRSDPSEEIAVVISNPPFYLAQEVIDQSRVIAPRAVIVMQLRLNFVGSEGRADFMRHNAPDVRTIPNRPSYALGETDSCEYAWLIWPPGRRTEGTFRVLGSTSLERRRDDMPMVAPCDLCAGLGYFDGAGVPRAKKKKRSGFGTKRPVESNPEDADLVSCRNCYARGKVAVAYPIPPRPHRERRAA